MKKTKKDSKVYPWFKEKTEIIGDFMVPTKYREKLKQYLEKADIKKIPYFEYGLITYGLVVASIILNIVFLSLGIFSNVTLILKIVLSIFLIPIIFILLTFLVLLAYKVSIEVKVYRKVREMEAKFPDFLSELSLNLKSGQNLEDALNYSAKKEFGKISKEIKKVYKKVRMGEELEIALNKFTESYNSDMLDQIFKLILISWKKGSGTPQLVDRIYDNLDTMRHLRQKVIASVTNYRIFLSIVTIGVAPAMFALSYYLIDLIRSITSKIMNYSTNTMLPIKINAVNFLDSHFIFFSSIAIILVAICASMIISIIKTGSIKDGLKQIIYFGFLSLISYRFFLFVFEKFFALFQV